jgi:hypothetical protein
VKFLILTTKIGNFKSVKNEQLEDFQISKVERAELVCGFFTGLFGLDEKRSSKTYLGNLGLGLVWLGEIRLSYLSKVRLFKLGWVRLGWV